MDPEKWLRLAASERNGGGRVRQPGARVRQAAHGVGNWLRSSGQRAWTGVRGLEERVEGNSERRRATPVRKGSGASEQRNA
jgi:hypothetical protein